MSFLGPDAAAQLQQRQRPPGSLGAGRAQLLPVRGVACEPRRQDSAAGGGLRLRLRLGGAEVCAGPTHRAEAKRMASCTWARLGAQYLCTEGVEVRSLAKLQVRTRRAGWCEWGLARGGPCTDGPGSCLTT